MTDKAAETLSVIVERAFPHAPEKLWRALTQPELIAAWLMQNDFTPVVDHDFTLRADWGAVACRVRVVEPNVTLSYTWAAAGTNVRMEQSGFLASQKQAYDGAAAGWPRFLDALETVTAGIV